MVIPRPRLPPAPRQWLLREGPRLPLRAPGLRGRPPPSRCPARSPRRIQPLWLQRLAGYPLDGRTCRDGRASVGKLLASLSDDVSGEVLMLDEGFDGTG